MLGRGFGLQTEAQLHNSHTPALQVKSAGFLSKLLWMDFITFLALPFRKKWQTTERKTGAQSDTAD